MKFSDIKISNQLRIVLGVVILGVLFLAGTSWLQTSTIWESTQGLYEHPLKTRRALGEINASFLTLRVNIRDFLLVEDKADRQNILNEMEVNRANLMKEINILRQTYLGPRQDIDDLLNESAKWISISEESVRIVNSGNLSEARHRHYPGGVAPKQAIRVLGAIKKISDFSLQRADIFYEAARENKNILLERLLFFVCMIMLVSVGAFYLLIRSITRPMDELKSVTELFRKGDLTARSAIVSKNEFGSLSGSFNLLAEKLETELTLNNQSSELSAIMLKEDDARLFFRSLLNALTEISGSNIGSIHILNEEKTEYVRFESTGLDVARVRSIPASETEAEFGPIIASRKIIHITEIPENSRFVFKTVPGDILPREMITVPIISGSETIAVISLATIRSFNINTLQFLDNILPTLSARVDGILSYRKIISFSQILENQNRELEMQKTELARAGAYNRSLIEASIDPLVTIGPDGKITDVNLSTEKVTGRNRKELIGTDFSDYFVDPGRAKEGYKQVFREGTVRDYELAIRRTDGTITPVLYNATVYRDEKENVIGVFAAARDISERKESEKRLRDLNDELSHRSDNLYAANQELEAQKKELASQSAELTGQNLELEMQKRQLNEANKLKTNFLSNMSHELRTPLNSVIALSGVLTRRLAGKVPEEEFGYLDVIERNGKQLLKMINDVLDLSRIEAGHEEIEIRSFRMESLVQEIADLIRPQADQKKITISVQTAGKPKPVSSDQQKCRHVIQNLISNAVKFTDKGGVEITVEGDDETVKVVVKDSGIGIDEGSISMIFDEFRQADDSNSRRYGGAGLGLAIAKKYADMLGGEIWVESALHKGSCFTLILPVSFSPGRINHSTHVEIPDPAPSETINEAILANAEGKTILIVEDSEAIIVQLKDILGSHGFAIEVAHDGNEAFGKISEKVPDTMILDLMMPGIDGFEVLKTIRENERTSLLPVIILTAKYITKQELAFLKHNGIHQLIRKGDINKEQLLEAIIRTMAPRTQHSKPVPGKITPARIDGEPRVLIVEDNPDNLLTIKALMPEKCRIFEAGDGAQGVELAKSERPHLILMDIALPGMNGIEALIELRKEQSTLNIPVIAVSASAMKGDREYFLKLGFDDYISKPIDGPVFVKVLEKWIGRKV